MIKIESAFQLPEFPAHRWGAGLRPAIFPAPETRELCLEGLMVSVEASGKTYDLSNRHAPADNGFRARGFAWLRQTVPLAPGVSLEQQLLRANNGSTVAISWRLLGRATSPVRLVARPIFATRTPISSESFAFEPETNGGRLVWLPFRSAARIIADTNGRPIAAARDYGNPNVALPASFEFQLSRRPSILLFSVEAQEQHGIDPLIGGFLAELAEPRSETETSAGLCALAAA